MDRQDDTFEKWSDESWDDTNERSTSMKYVFGPVPSRRLGQSLGIDPIPLKTCNWNCVYCQLGRTMPITNDRKVFFDPEVILSQTKEALQAHQAGGIDWITFIGSGETTLDASLGYMIREVKKMTTLPVAVITNGSLLYKAEVREELSGADAVLPSLDAGNAALYRKINRPHHELSFKRLVDGLREFRAMYAGKLWIEVMLIKGMNDSEAALQEIAAKLEDIQPDEVHILQPTRPPVELWVKAPDQEGILRAQAILGKVAKILVPGKGTFELDDEEDLVDAIVNIITRHPMREVEIAETLQEQSTVTIAETLKALENSGRAKVVIRYGERFWSAANTFFPEDKDSKKD